MTEKNRIPPHYRIPHSLRQDSGFISAPPIYRLILLEIIGLSYFKIQIEYFNDKPFEFQPGQYVVSFGELAILLNVDKNHVQRALKFWAKKGFLKYEKISQVIRETIRQVIHDKTVITLTHSSVCELIKDACDTTSDTTSDFEVIREPQESKPSSSPPSPFSLSSPSLEISPPIPISLSSSSPPKKGRKTTAQDGVFFNRDKNIFENISEIHLKKWKSLHPELNIEKIISEAEIFLMDNPKYKGTAGFITNQLNMAQERQKNKKVIPYENIAKSTSSSNPKPTAKYAFKRTEPDLD